MTKTYLSFIILSICSIISLASGCDKKKDDTPDPPPAKPDFVKIEYNVNDLKIHQGFSQHTDRGLLTNKDIDEASGIAVSRSNPKRIWVHNDSGDPNCLFVIGENGENYGFFWIWGTGNRDWEDMCIGAGPEEGINYLYVADIGDNDAKYDHIVINRFPEPDISGLDTVGINRVEAEDVERMIMVYPDGPRDAETLMIDPWTKDLYIVTKREARSSVYVARYPQSVTEKTTLEKVAELPFNRALSGDISADGKEIVIKTDRRLYYWKREQGESVTDALKRVPELLPYFVEPQGEAFAWTPDASGYYTLSEQSGNILPRLYYYAKK